MKILLTNTSKNFLVALVLLAACLLTYSNSLRNEFLIDDHGLVFEDKRIHNLKYFLRYFGASGQAYDEELQNLRYYRPLNHTIPMVCYYFFKDDPFGYHLTNLVLFYISCLGFYFLVNCLIRDKMLAFITSLLFATHPINGMLVNYNTASALSVLIFSLQFSLISFLKAHREKKNIFYLWSYLGFGISLLCHEVAMVFPFYLIFTLLFFENDGWKKTWSITAPYFLVLFLYFLFRLGHASLKDNIFDNITFFNISPSVYFATFSKCVWWYLNTLLSLENIVLTWAVPLVKENAWLWNIGLWFGLFFSLALIIKFWKKNIVSFALGWFLIGLMPVAFACLVNPPVFTMEPHWLFFASLGLFLVLGNLLMRLKQIINTRVWLLVILVFVCVYVLRSRDYNYIWGSEKRYCYYWLKVMPNFKGVFSHLAYAYMQNGEYERARELYKRAIENKHSDWVVYNNLGLMDYQEGKLEEARRYFEESLARKPDSAVVYNNLGLVFFMQGQNEPAAMAFEKAIYYNFFLLQARINLANIYKKKGIWNQAENLYKENLKIDSGDQASSIGLIDTLFASGKKEEAVKLGKDLLRKNKNEEFLTQLGSLFALNRYSNLAFALYTKAIKLNPKYTPAYLEMGKLYGNLDQFNQAIAIWQEGSGH